MFYFTNQSQLQGHSHYNPQSRGPSFPPSGFSVFCQCSYFSSSVIAAAAPFHKSSVFAVALLIRAVESSNMTASRKYSSHFRGGSLCGGSQRCISFFAAVNPASHIFCCLVFKSKFESSLSRRRFGSMGTVMPIMRDMSPKVYNIWTIPHHEFKCRSYS